MVVFIALPPCATNVRGVRLLSYIIHKSTSLAKRSNKQVLQSCHITSSDDIHGYVMTALAHSFGNTIDG